MTYKIYTCRRYLSLALAITRIGNDLVRSISRYLTESVNVKLGHGAGRLVSHWSPGLSQHYKVAMSACCYKLVPVLM